MTLHEGSHRTSTVSSLPDLKSRTFFTESLTIDHNMSIIGTLSNHDGDAMENVS